MDTFHFKEILQSFDLVFLNHSSVEMFSGTDRYAPELEDFICFSQLHLNAVVNILQWFQLHLNHILSLLFFPWLTRPSVTNMFLHTRPTDDSNMSLKKKRRYAQAPYIIASLLHWNIKVYIYLSLSWRERTKSRKELVASVVACFLRVKREKKKDFESRTGRPQWRVAIDFVHREGRETDSQPRSHTHTYTHTYIYIYTHTHTFPSSFFVRSIKTDYIPDFALHLLQEEHQKHQMLTGAWFYMISVGCRATSTVGFVAQKVQRQIKGEKILVVHKPTPLTWKTS